MPQAKCKICDKEFYVKPSHLLLGYGKYCSMDCLHESRKTGKFVKCHVCGKDVWKTQKALRNSKSNKFFCNKSCQTKWRNVEYSGENHHFWKGGENAYRGILIKSGVKTQCKMCGNKDFRLLVVHHLDTNRKNNKVDNLIWLCQNCHHLVHAHKVKVKKINYGGRSSIG